MNLRHRITALLTAAFMLLSIGNISAVFAADATYSVSVSSGNFGNIFYTPNPDFVQKIKSSAAGSVTVVTEVTDDKGIVVKKDREYATLSANSEKQLNYSASDLPYGVYKLRTGIYGEDGALETSAETDFSVVKPAGKVNDEVGIHVLFQNDMLYMSKLSDIAQLYKNTGFSSFRDSGWTWKNIERNKGEYSLTTFFKNEKNVFTSDKEHSMLLTLNYGHSDYTGSDASYAKTDDELKAWYNYCYNLALLTKDMPVSFEVFNEFDMRGSPSEYFPLLKNAYLAVKAANPDAKVIGMVTSWSCLWFIKDVVNLGGANYFDAISIHPYTWSYTPEQFNLMDDIASVRNYMDANSMKDKELIVTELGYYGYVGREQQASDYVRTLALNKVSGVADKFYFYRYAQSVNPTPNEDFGLIRRNTADTPFSAFPAIPALSYYNSVMTDAVYEKTVADGCYQFRLSSGEDCIMMWSDTPRSVSLNLGASSVTLADMYGNERKIESDGGEYTFASTADISYIIGNFGAAAKIENPSSVKLSDVAVKNTNNSFAKVYASGSGIAACDSVKISASENVLAYSGKTADGFELNFLNMSADDGYAYAEFFSGDRRIYSGRFLIQKECGSDTVYDMRTDGYNTNYQHGIYNDETDGDGAVLIWDTASTRVTHTVYSKSFNEAGDLLINLNLKMTGNANVSIKASNGSADAEILRADENGTFICGTKTEKTVSYLPDKWYNIECVYHSAQKSFDVYTDGEYVGTKTGADYSDGMKNVSVTAESQDGSYVYLRDLRVSAYSAAGLTVKSADISDDNSQITVEFSGALAADADLSAICVADMFGSSVGVAEVEKERSDRVKLTLSQPLDSDAVYTVFVNGELRGGAGTVCNKDEINTAANSTESKPMITAICSFDGKLRTKNNCISPTGRIVVLLNESLGEDLNPDDCVELMHGGENVSKTIEITSDRRGIIISPEGALTENEKYRIHLSSLVTADNRAFDDTAAELTVHQNYVKTADGIIGNISDDEMFAVTADYNTNTISIRGKTGAANDLVTLLVLKPDSANIGSDSIAAVKELLCNQFGEYDVSFEVDGIAGEYRIFMNSLSDKNKREKQAEFRNYIPNISVTKDNADVTKMSDLKDGDAFKVCVSGFNTAKDFRGTVYVAQYKGNTLNSVKCIDGSANSTYIGSEITFTDTVNGGTDSIKVMYFDNSNIMPLCACYDIE